MTGKGLFLAAGTAGVLLLGPGLENTSAQTSYYHGTRTRPLEGRRYETMRALAHFLDEAAQGTLQGAIEGSHHGRSSEKKFISSVRDFARRADGFHRRMDDYQASPFDLPSQVNDLASRARRVNDRLRSAHALEDTYDDWDAAIDVLNRMRQLMAGQNVRVPVAHGRFEDYDQDYGPFRGEDLEGAVPTGNAGVSSFSLSGSRLQEFRRLAHDLEVSATRVHEVAERNQGNDSDRGQPFLADLHQFADQTRDVHSRADADAVDPREIGPTVNRLLQGARDTDRSMRESRVFTQVWEEWTRTIDILNRMANLVRY